MELRQFTWLWNEASKPLYLKPPIHWQALISYPCMDAEICIVLEVRHESKCLHHLVDFREFVLLHRVETVVRLVGLEQLAGLEELILVICRTVATIGAPLLHASPPSALSLSYWLTTQSLQRRNFDHPIVIVGMCASPEMARTRLPGILRIWPHLRLVVVALCLPDDVVQQPVSYPVTLRGLELWQVGDCGLVAPDN